MSIAWATVFSYANEFSPVPQPGPDGKILVLHNAELSPHLRGTGMMQKALRALWQARQPETWDMALVNALPAQYPRDFSILPSELLAEAYEDQERLLQHAQLLLAGMVKSERVLPCIMERT